MTPLATTIYRRFLMRLTATVSLILAMSSAVADDPGPLQAQWAKGFNTAGIHYSHITGTVDAAGRLWLLVARRDGDSLLSLQNLELWRLDAAGGDRVAMPIAARHDIVINANRFQAITAVGTGITLALAADAGAYLVNVPGEWADRTESLVTEAAESETLALIPRPDRRPVVVTNRGVIVHDPGEDRWHTVWRQPPSAFLLGTAAAAADDRIAVLVGQLDQDTTELSVVLLDLNDIEAIEVRTVALPPGGGNAMWSRISGHADGSFAVATPLGPPDDARWRLSALDAELNLQGAREVDLVEMNMTRTELSEWRDRSFLTGVESGTMNPALFLFTAEGPAKRMRPPSVTKERWNKTSRVSLYGAGQPVSYLVISGQSAEPDFSRLRGSLRIVRLK